MFLQPTSFFCYKWFHPQNLQFLICNYNKNLITPSHLALPVSLTESGQIIDIQAISWLELLVLQFIGFRNKLHHDLGLESLSGSRNSQPARERWGEKKFKVFLAKEDLISLHSSLEFLKQLLHTSVTSFSYYPSPSHSPCLSLSNPVSVWPVKPTSKSTSAFLNEAKVWWDF